MKNPNKGEKVIREVRAIFAKAYTSIPYSLNFSLTPNSLKSMLYQSETNFGTPGSSKLKILNSLLKY